ncbi:hypothetical protein Tco_0090822 [Tanacetum coccineum]
MNLFKISTSSRRSLGEEDASKQRRNLKRGKQSLIFEGSDFDEEFDANMDEAIEQVYDANKDTFEEGEVQVPTTDMEVNTVSAPVTTAGVSISTAEPITTATLVRMRSEKSKVRGVVMKEPSETATRPTAKTPPPRRVNNNYPRPKTPQPKRNVGRQNQPHGFSLAIDHYILYDRVMNPLAPHYERKTRSNHGTKRCRDSNLSSSFTALNHSSSSHHIDENVDDNDEESYHSSTLSLPQLISSLSNVVPRVFENLPHESQSLNSYQTEIINHQIQHRDEQRKGLRSIGKVLKDMMKGNKK